jgi:hypothetical protein
MFLTAVSLFGTLISQLNEIVAKQTSQTKELDEKLDMYLAIQPKYVYMPRSGLKLYAITGLMTP